MTKRNTKSKYESKSTKCIMVGYAEDHAPDCYRFLNLETRKIIQSRDVIWTEELNGKESDEEIQETEVESDAEDQIVRPPYVESGEATSERITPCIDQLQNLMAVEENIKGVIIPTTYEKAVKEVRWKDAMIKELSNIEQRYVWEKMKLSELPPNAKCFGTRWVYTVKESSKYKARLVVLGCYQRHLVLIIRKHLHQLHLMQLSGHYYAWQTTKIGRYNI